jgi:hypothetical protein
MFERVVEADGAVRLKTERCEILVWRLRPRVLLMRIEGYDGGDFGNAPFDELRSEIQNFKSVDLFVDLSAAFGARTPVREQWTEWFRANQDVLRRVHILVGSRFIEMAVTLAKLFSRTGELIQIYSSPQVFEEAISGKRAPP